MFKRIGSQLRPFFNTMTRCHMSSALGNGNVENITTSLHSSNMKTILERCNGDTRIAAAILKRFKDDLERANTFLDKVENDLTFYKIGSNGALLTGVTEKGAQEDAKNEHEAYTRSMY